MIPRSFLFAAVLVASMMLSAHAQTATPAASPPLPPGMPPLPQGWVRNGYREWSQGDATISFDADAPPESIATARAEAEARMKQAAVTPVLDDVVRVCHGTADGWRLETIDTSGGSPHVVLYIMTANAARQRIEITYDAPGSAVPADVMTALESVCPPK